jgi:hypothetical protein
VQKPTTEVTCDGEGSHPVAWSPPLPVSHRTFRHVNDATITPYRNLTVTSRTEGSDEEPKVATISVVHSYSSPLCLRQSTAAGLWSIVN